jgi:hypothetical protein
MYTCFLTSSYIYNLAPLKDITRDVLEAFMYSLDLWKNCLYTAA